MIPATAPYFVRQPRTPASPAGGSHRRVQSRNNSFPSPPRFNGDEVGTRESDFSLATSYLVTPTTPDREKTKSSWCACSFHSFLLVSRCSHGYFQPRHPSFVNPASPLFPLGRFLTLPPWEEHPSALCIATHPPIRWRSSSTLASVLSADLTHDDSKQKHEQNVPTGPDPAKIGVLCEIRDEVGEGFAPKIGANRPFDKLRS